MYACTVSFESEGTRIRIQKEPAPVNWSCVVPSPRCSPVLTQQLDPPPRLACGEEEIDGIACCPCAKRGKTTTPHNTTRSASLARPLRRPRGPENPSNQYNAVNTGETTSGTGGSRNSKTANRLSECALESHCRRRRGESVPHITFYLLRWDVAERIPYRKNPHHTQCKSHCALSALGSLRTQCPVLCHNSALT